MSTYNDTPARSRATVLLVDDSLANLNIFGEVLAPFYNVRVANSGRRALEVVDTDPIPDIILLDVMMPQMDGYSVLQAFRDDPKHREIPVIFVTAVDEIESEEFGLALGAVDFITKPVKPALLLARVRTHLAIKAEHDAQQTRIALLVEEVRKLMAEKAALEDQNLQATNTMSMMKGLLAKKSLDDLAEQPTQKIGDTFFQELDIAPSLVNLP